MSSQTVPMIVAACVLSLSACAGRYPEADTDQLIGRLQGQLDRNEAAIDGVRPGCSAAGWRYDRFSLSRHVVVSSSRGNVLSHDGSEREAFQAIVDGVLAWSRGLPDGRPRRLMLYFNGGLNAREDVLRQAARQVPCILSDGYYPVFMVWDTAGPRSYAEQAFWVRDGQVAKERRLASGSLRILGDTIAGIGRAPSDYVVHGRRYFNAMLRGRPCLDLMEPRLARPDCAEAQLVAQPPRGGEVTAARNVVFDPATADARHPEVGANLGYIAALPARLLATPLIDGLGASAWRNFLRRTRTTIRRDVEFDLNRERDVACPMNLAEDMEAFRWGTGAFAKVFQLLNDTLNERTRPPEQWLRTGRWKCAEDEAGALHDVAEDTPPIDPASLIAFRALRPRITLVGHSMGAIVVDEVLATFRDLPYEDVVLMAAASSVRDARHAVEPVMLMASHPGMRLYHLSLHALNDQREFNAMGAAPSGSLLVWVDEMYQPALTPEDRVFGFWPNAKAARPLFNPEVAARTLYRVFSRPPRPTEPCADGTRGCVAANPVRHGDFNEDAMCFWRPAFWGAGMVDWRQHYADPPQLLQECRVGP